MMETFTGDILQPPHKYLTPAVVRYINLRKGECFISFILSIYLYLYYSYTCKESKRLYMPN